MSKLLYPLSRPVVCGVALAAVAACAWRFDYAPLTKAIADYREGRQTMAQGGARAAELQASMDRRWARLEAKQRIVKDLIAGRVSVNDAGWQYEDLPGAPPGFLEHLRALEQGASDHERLCRHLIDYACDYVDDEPGRQALQHRLLEDLDKNLQHFRQPIAALPAQ